MPTNSGQRSLLRGILAARRFTYVREAVAATRSSIAYSDRMLAPPAARGRTSHLHNVSTVDVDRDEGDDLRPRLPGQPASIVNAIREREWIAPGGQSKNEDTQTGTKFCLTCSFRIY